MKSCHMYSRSEQKCSTGHLWLEKFRSSVGEGVVPREQKRANVPFLKKEDRDNAVNKTISLTNVILEKVIRKYMEDEKVPK